MHTASVIVSIYNQTQASVFQTLNSIIEQDFDNFEIIVSDDCSQENPQKAIEAYFSEHSFDDYKIIVHESNLGTTRNCLEAMKVADGEFVKWIGAGDLLFNSDTLRKLCEFAQAKEINLAFGKVMAFIVESGGISFRPFDAPVNPQLYSGVQDRMTILAQHLLYSDWIPGVALFCRREYLIRYLSALADEYHVKYCEDLVPTLVAFNDRIEFYDDYLLWYEWGTGISNSGNKASRKKMYADHTNFYSALRGRSDNTELIKRAYKLFKLKRFIMLHTPFARFLQRYKASRHISRPIDNTDEEMLEGKVFLLNNLV